MSAAYTEPVRQKFAGELSEDESRLASDLRESFRETLAGHVGFGDEVMALSKLLNDLRPFRYDVDAAVASGTVRPVLSVKASAVTPLPLSAEERQFLDDADGLVDWVTRNHVNFHTILAILGHDVGELSRHEFDLGKTLADFVVPKVTGWAKRNSDPIGDAEDQS